MLSSPSSSILSFPPSLLRLLQSRWRLNVGPRPHRHKIWHRTSYDGDGRWRMLIGQGEVRKGGPWLVVVERDELIRCDMIAYIYRYLNRSLQRLWVLGALHSWVCPWVSLPGLNFFLELSKSWGRLVFLIGPLNFKAQSWHRTGLSVRPFWWFFFFCCCSFVLLS